MNSLLNPAPYWYAGLNMPDLAEWLAWREQKKGETT